MTYDASDRKHVRKAEKEAETAAFQRAEAVKSIMSVVPGRAWMLDMLTFCGHFLPTTFTGDPQTTAFGEGQRSVAQHLVDDIMRVCPDNFILMLRERNSRDAARSPPTERSSESVPDGGDSGPVESDAA